MIFDSNEIKDAIKKYRYKKNFDIPEIVFLAKFPKLKAERELLESVIIQVDATRRNEWFYKIIQEDRGNHMGAWFEMMLYAWLCQQDGIVQTPVEYLNDHPDFVFTKFGYKIAIEAHAISKKPYSIEEEKVESALINRIRRIQFPYIIHFEDYKFNSKINYDEVISVIKEWIKSDGNNQIEYHDKYNNEFTLSLGRKWASTHAEPTFSPEAFMIDSYPLQNPIKGKILQHPNIIEKKSPYVLALFLEPWYYSADTVLNAMFGNEKLIYNTETNQLIDNKFDGTGILLSNSDQIKKALSGVLTFKRSFQPTKGIHTFTITYHQNPFSQAPIFTDIFQVDSEHVVVGQSFRGFEINR